LIKVPKILFRLDAGKKAGYGHLSRNLTLAEAFYEKSCNGEFLIKSDDQKGVEDFILNFSTIDFKVKFLPFDLPNKEDLNMIINEYNNGCSFLILDHYQHDKAYQLFLKKHRVRWAQFDYKKTEEIFADVLINPNLGVTTSDYDGLVDSKTKLCVGENFTIIRKEFHQVKRQSIKNRILIAMGGGNYLPEGLDMISTLVNEKDFHFDIVGGGVIIDEMFGQLKNTTIYRNPINVAEIFAQAKYAVVAGGVTTYELAYIGVPMIIVPFAENQKSNAIAFQKKNQGVRFEGPAEFRKEIEYKGLNSVIEKLNINCLNIKIIDGKGIDRVLETINQKLQK
jgi:UDP-2,4-diacetamido-2,4,6-trideoxy-beta-L-altropyranose hydrolase